MDQWAIALLSPMIQEAIVKCFSYGQLRTHRADFMAVSTPSEDSRPLAYEYICKIRTAEPDRFILNPIHHMPGMNTEGRSSRRGDSRIWLTDLIHHRIPAMD